MGIIKKKSFWLMLGLVLLLLSACGKDPREDMIQSLAKVSNMKQGAGTFEMKIKDLQLGDTSQNSSVAMVTSQIKNARISGDYIKDNKAAEVNIKLQAAGLEIPFTLVGNGKDTYISTDFVQPVVKIASSFGQNVPVNEAQLEKIKGKYLSLQEVNKLSQTETKNNQIDPKTAEAFAKDYQKEVRDYLKKLDKKSFTVDGDVITHTFDKKEMLEVVKLAQKTAESKKEYAEYKKLFSEKDFQKALDTFQKLTLKLSVNKKTDKTDMIYTIVPKDQQSLKSLALEMTVTPSKYKKAPVMPKKADILSNEEFQKLLSQPKPQTQTQPQVKITDEQFKQVLNQIKQVKATGQTIDAAKKQQLLQTYKAYLSDEQYKELRTELDK